MPPHPPVTPEGTFLQAFRLNHALRRHSGAGGPFSYGIPSKTPVQAPFSRRRAHFCREGRRILAQESRASARTTAGLSAGRRRGRRGHRDRQGHHADKGRRRGQASCCLLAVRGHPSPSRNPNRPTCQARQTSRCPTWDGPSQSLQREARGTASPQAPPSGQQQSRRGSSYSPPGRSAVGLPCPPQIGHDRRPMTRRYPSPKSPGSTVPGTTLLPQCSGEPERRRQPFRRRKERFRRHFHQSSPSGVFLNRTPNLGERKSETRRCGSSCPGTTLT
jgi:hypothetical protein